MIYLQLDGLEADGAWQAAPPALTSPVCFTSAFQTLVNKVKPFHGLDEMMTMIKPTDRE